MSAISVILITKNEEANIRACLDSVRWADQIVVVDAGSTDKTLQIARTMTKSVFVRRWDGFGPAKNFALKKCRGEWVFWIDADERVTEALASEIRKVVSSKELQQAAFSVPRKAFFLGKWIRHSGWYPARVVRVFRKGRGTFTDQKVHERLMVEGEIGELHSDLLHNTDPTLQHYFEKFNRYTSLGAEELLVEKQRFSMAQLLVRPFWTFFRMYVLKAGFLDGLPGFILCILSSGYVFTKYAKLWELDVNRQGNHHD